MVQQCWILLGMFLVTVHGQTLQNTKDLYTKLFITDNYNKMIRPLNNQSDLVFILSELYLDAIVSFDEQEGSLSTSAYLAMTWDDEGLRWNKSDFGGVSTINVPQEYVWRPDLTLANSLESLKELGYPGLNVMVGSEGNVSWSPLQLLKSRCDVDITYFPFDTQTCALIFFAWSYDVSQVQLSVFDEDRVAVADNFVPNAQWTLVASSVSQDHQIASITFTLKLERKSAFYVMNIILPVVMLSVLSIFVFALPVKSGERASFSVTVFLSMAVFLTIVASALPKNSDVTPMIGVYLIVMSGMNTAIAIISVFQIRLAGRDEKEPAPEIGSAHRTVYKLASALTCSGCKSRSNRKVAHASSTSSVSILSNASKSGHQNNIVNNVPAYPSTADLCQDCPDEMGNADTNNGDTGDKINWNDVADSLDVLFFVLTTLLTIVSTATFLIIVIFNPQKVENRYAELEEEPYVAPWEYDYYY